MSPAASEDNVINLSIGSHKIERIYSCKYLGVIFDEHLNWKLHVDYILSKLIKFIGIFYKVRDFLPPDCIKKLYYAFIYPHIIFGIEIYGAANKKVLDRIYILNNKILRILLKQKRDSHARDLYVRLNTLPVSLLYKMQLMLLIHKCIYFASELPIVFQNHLDFNKDFILTIPVLKTLFIYTVQILLENFVLILEEVNTGIPYPLRYVNTVQHLYLKKLSLHI